MINRQTIEHMCAAGVFLFVSFSLLGCSRAKRTANSGKNCETVAQILGESICRHQLSSDRDKMVQQLRDKVLGKVYEHIRRQHPETIPPTETEVQAFMDHMGNGSSARVSRKIARALVLYRRTQYYIYTEYGGGRVLFQQAGWEAFDATKAMFHELEKKGKMSIADPELRDRFYEYWNKDHGPWIVSDKKEIRHRFLERPWTETLPDEWDTESKKNGATSRQRKSKCLRRKNCEKMSERRKTVVLSSMRSPARSGT